MSYKALINKVFTRKYQFALQPNSVEFLEEVLSEHEIAPDQVQDALEAIAKECQKQGDCTTIVTRDILVRVYELMREAGEDGPSVNPLDADLLDPENHLFIIDAFDMPSWYYSADRKAFERTPWKSAVGGTAQSRTQLMRSRHDLIKQFVLRNENFSPPISGRDRASYLKITSTKNLLGRIGERFLLFGMLSHDSAGKLCLEDTEGKVMLDITDTAPSEGFFTEGCFVLVEGDYTANESFAVIAIGHPPSERRAVARSIFGHIDMLGNGATTVLEDASYQERLELEYSRLSFLVMSDLWLDHRRTLEGLSKVFEGCVENDFIPLIFILCGNFTSGSLDLTSGDGLAKYQDNLDSLADLIAGFPAISRNSHFVFVPGPLDPWGSSTLPRRPLPSSFTSRIRSRVPKSHFPSNPARIKFFGLEVVIFREDLMAKMLRNLIGVKPDLQGSDLKRFLVQTIVDQCNLSPLPFPVSPILWDFDHALRLYPMPSAVILADSYERYDLTYEGCHVFNPGNFVGNEFGFSIYFPATGRSEASSIDTENVE
ncbi:epsilon DNA polymerase [Cantharellus anzutake]|uniref:epsilon DNA polymerase n=1 Tax=Cantharellus anzutake TaxID=1750568 RepID=UPI0019086791|nr:epsilon DNA polymerase [Cantharellus anzutake]KAF8337053.1 epsilon DNA polymerase [Cantharellus anzutake]